MKIAGGGPKELLKDNRGSVKTAKESKLSSGLSLNLKVQMRPKTESHNPSSIKLRMGPGPKVYWGPSF